MFCLSNRTGTIPEKEVDRCPELRSTYIIYDYTQRAWLYYNQSDSQELYRWRWRWKEITS